MCKSLQQNTVQDKVWWVSAKGGEEEDGTLKAFVKHHKHVMQIDLCVKSNTEISQPKNTEEPRQTKYYNGATGTADTTKQNTT